MKLHLIITHNLEFRTKILKQEQISLFLRKSLQTQRQFYQSLQIAYLRNYSLKYVLTTPHLPNVFAISS